MVSGVRRDSREGNVEDTERPENNENINLANSAPNNEDHNNDTMVNSDEEAGLSTDDNGSAPNPHRRIRGQDMRAWLQTYSLTLHVYVCANKFLMDDFKTAVRRYCVNMLETAGADAATSEVLQLCSTLWAGVPESDALLKMVLARMCFLQPILWRRAPTETGEFLIANPEVSALMIKEAALRREVDIINGNEAANRGYHGGAPPGPGMRWAVPAGVGGPPGNGESALPSMEVPGDGDEERRGGRSRRRRRGNDRGPGGGRYMSPPGGPFRGMPPPPGPGERGPTIIY